MWHLPFKPFLLIPKLSDRSCKLAFGVAEPGVTWYPILYSASTFSLVRRLKYLEVLVVYLCEEWYDGNFPVVEQFNCVICQVSSTSIKEQDILPAFISVCTCFRKKVANPLKNNIFIKWCNTFSPERKPFLNKKLWNFSLKKPFDNDGSQAPWKIAAGWMLTLSAKNATSTYMWLIHLNWARELTALVLVSTTTLFRFVDFRSWPRPNPVSSKFQFCDGLRVFRMRSTIMTCKRK